jgi:hypothetical protein
MKPHIGKIAENLATIPLGTRLAILLADDTGTEVLLPPAPASLASLRDAAIAVSKLNCEGGKPQLHMLNEAFRLASAEPNGQIIWMHGAVPVLLGQMQSLLQSLERMSNGTEIYDLQFGLGPNRIAEALDGFTSVHSLPVMENGDKALEMAFGSPDQPRWEWVRQSLQDRETQGVETSRHLARLWAREEVQRLCAGGDPQTREKAVKVARDYAIVTPVSGAVVLENGQQYAEAGLSPVDAQSVPTVPEPGIWVLLAVIIALLLLVRTMRWARTC